MGAFVVILVLLMLGVSALMIVSGWVVFAKAGQPGWAIFIPVYNTIVALKVANMPWWNLFLLLIPIVNIIYLFMMYIRTAKAFGKSAGFGVGMAFLPVIFYPILAFTKTDYDVTRI